MNLIISSLKPRLVRPFGPYGLEPELQSKPSSVRAWVEIIIWCCLALLLRRYLLSICKFSRRKSTRFPSSLSEHNLVKLLNSPKKEKFLQHLFIYLFSVRTMHVVGCRWKSEMLSPDSMQHIHGAVSVISPAPAAARPLPTNHAPLHQISYDLSQTCAYL